MEDLSGYKPEAPEERSNNPFKYKGPINVLKTEKVQGARIEVAEKDFNGEFSSTKAGDKLVQIPLQVPEVVEKVGKRVVFKRWNIDSTVTNKAGKTQAQQLADWLNPNRTGLVISNEASLEVVINRLNTEPFDAHLWVIDIGEKKIQMSKLDKSGAYKIEVGGNNEPGLVSGTPKF